MKYFLKILIVQLFLLYNNIFCLSLNQNYPANQYNSFESTYFNIILSRPTDRSITISFLPLKNITLFFEYGKSDGGILTRTETKTLKKDIPFEIELSNLEIDNRYIYRVNYKEESGSIFNVSPDYFFHTQRAKNSSFSFTIEADPHPYDKKGSHNLWNICLTNQLIDNPDFMIDLGDTFGDDHNPFTTTSGDTKQLRLDNRNHFGSVCHSIPLFFCSGNHEGESGYYLFQTPPDNIGVNGTIWRKYYYPNPEPNWFYSGNGTSESYGMGLPQNYYSFEWGDALFVVLDAYRYYTSSAKPRGWEWTLGESQYKWFQQVLEASSAKFKFVFIHHILGQSRGGVKVAGDFEWGGYNSQGVYEFDTMRPGWGVPIHQLMVKNKVNIFFQGHDHLYAKEILDGIIYQEVPMPSDSTYIIGTRDNGDSYPDPSLNIDASGHLRVTVSSTEVTVDYIRAWLPNDETVQRKNGEVAHSYKVTSGPTSIQKDYQLPAEVILHQNYPNPFNPSTTINYQISDASFVTLKIHDMLGREIVTLVDEYKQPGYYSSQFFSNKYNLSSGVYLYQLKAGSKVETRKAIMLK